MAIKTKSAPLDAQIADRLLDLLSTDDSFRERFEHDPRAALREIGYESPIPAKMTACGSLPAPDPEPLIDCKVENLATKEAIAAAREEIRGMLTSGMAQTPPQLDTVEAASRRLRK